MKLVEALALRQVGQVGLKPREMATLAFERRFTKRKAMAWAMPGATVRDGVGEATHLEEAPLPVETSTTSSTHALLAVDISAAERFAVTGSNHGAVTVTPLDHDDAPTKRKMRRHRSAVCGVQWYAGDDGVFMSAGTDGSVYIWDAARQDVVCELGTSTGIYAAAMSRIIEGPPCVVACGCRDGSIRLSDARSGSSTTRLDGGHRNAVTSVEITFPLYRDRIFLLFLPVSTWLIILVA